MLLPKIVAKHPQNIHNLLEFLFVDLEIWVNGTKLSDFAAPFSYADPLASSQFSSSQAQRKKRNTKSTRAEPNQPTPSTLRNSSCPEMLCGAL